MTNARIFPNFSMWLGFALLGLTALFVSMRSIENRSMNILLVLGCFLVLTSIVLVVVLFRKERRIAKTDLQRREMVWKIVAGKDYVRPDSLLDLEVEGFLVLSVLQNYEDKELIGKYKRYLLEFRDLTVVSLKGADPARSAYKEELRQLMILHKLPSWREFFKQPDSGFSDTTLIPVVNTPLVV